MYGSSRQEVFCKKGVLRNFAKFTGKHLCQNLFFNKVAGLACNLIKKEILAQLFSFEFCKISKNTYSYRTPPLAASECSRNLGFEKQTDQNFITQNLCHGKEYCISKKSKF